MEQNRAFHEHLKSLDYAHEYEEHPGTHDWHFWDHHVRAAIDFHRRNLRIPGDPVDAVIR